MIKDKRTYQDGLEDCCNIIEKLKDIEYERWSAYHLVHSFITDKRILRDKNGVVIKEWDIMRINPEDDDWLDVVIRYMGVLIYASELNGSDPVRLRECLEGSDNPSIIEGNLRNVEEIKFINFEE